jgi:hypothetical protein
MSTKKLMSPRCAGGSAGASASKAVGTPEMVTPETLKLMVLLVEDGIVDDHRRSGWWPCG